MDANFVVIRKGIINTLAASGDNVKDDAASVPNHAGACIICVLNTVTPPVEILPPIWKDEVVSVKYLSSQAEVVQQVVVGRLEEVVVASERYQISIGNEVQKSESGKQALWRYNYVAPATLTGTAATDRSNMYTALNTKINADARNNTTSYLIHSVAFTVGDTALLAVGEVITQATSTATAVVVAVDVTGGNITAGNAVGTIYLRTVTGTWQVGSLVSTGGTSSGVITTAALLTENQGLVIIDDANYYPPRPLTRRGISTIVMTDGFATATLELGIATLAAGTTGMTIGVIGLYSRGIGSRMILDVPSFTPDKVYLTEGEAPFILNAAPDAAKTYRTYLIELNTKPSDNVLTGYTKGGLVRYELFAEEDSGLTNVGDFNTAFTAALPITIIGA